MKKFLSMLLCALLCALSLGSLCMAQDTTDWTFTEDTVIDFCVYNTWGVKSVEVNKATIQNIRMVVEVSEFSGDPVTVKLYNRESTTWGWWTSEAQVIDGDGLYCFDVDCSEGEYDAETLCTIYLKDVACASSADEDPADGGNQTASGVNAHIKLVSCKFNTDLSQPAAELTAAEETTEETTEETVDAAEETAAETTGTEAAAEATEDSSSDSSPVTIIVICCIVVVGIAAVILTLTRKKK